MAKCFHPNVLSLGVLTSSPDSFDSQMMNGEHQKGQRNFVSCPKSVVKIDKKNETKSRARLPLKLEKLKSERLFHESETKLRKTSRETSKEGFLNQSKNKNDKSKRITNINGDKSCVNDATDMPDGFKTDKKEVAINKQTWRENTKNLNELRLALEKANLETSVTHSEKKFLQTETNLDVQVNCNSFTDSSSSSFRHVWPSQSFRNNLQNDSDCCDLLQSITNDKNQNTDIATASNTVPFLVSLYHNKKKDVGVSLRDGILASVEEPNNVIRETFEINNNDFEALLTGEKNENLLKSTEEEVEKSFLHLNFNRDKISKCFKMVTEELFEEMESDGSVNAGVDAGASFATETRNPDTCDYERSQTPMEVKDVQARLQRSSSLKTNTATLGTSGSKKIVRFADALGLDLADVRTFLDEVPKIPSSAYKYLDSDSTTSESSFSPSLTLVPMFQQPGYQINFMDKLQTQSVCLETVLVTNSSSLSVAGTVRVLNLNYHKSVLVRYSINNWKTFFDLQAVYVPGSCDGSTDKFSFVIYGHSLKAGDKIEMALCYSCNGNQYWDNNAGINYSFNCLPETSANGFFSRGNDVVISNL